MAQAQINEIAGLYLASVVPRGEIGERDVRFSANRNLGQWRAGNLFLQGGRARSSAVPRRRLGSAFALQSSPAAQSGGIMAREQPSYREVQLQGKMGYGNHRSLWGSRDRSFRRRLPAIAAEKNTAGTPKNAVDALLTRLDSIGHDPDMTTAKKAIVAAEAMEKFNQQYKGKPLTVRLKIHGCRPLCPGALPDGEPSQSGRRPILHEQVPDQPVQHRSHVGHQGQRTGGDGPGERQQLSRKPHSQVRTSSSRAAASPSPCARTRLAGSVWTTSHISLTLRPGPAWMPPNGPASATSPSSLFASGKTANGTTLADKLKSEKLRSMDDVKSFFLRGIVQPKHPSASQNMGTAGKAGMGQTYGSNTRSGSGYGSPSGSARPARQGQAQSYLYDCRNHPEVRQSVFWLRATTSEQWVYKIRKMASCMSTSRRSATQAVRPRPGRKP